MRILHIMLAVALGLVAAGCILSAQYTMDQDFTADFTNGFERVTIDLRDVDHFDKLDRIERLDLEAIIRNDLSAKDTLDVYICADSTLASKTAVEAATNAYPLILDYVTKPGPASYDTLTVIEARAILKVPGSNWEQVKTIVNSGLFSVYFTSTGTGASGAVTKGTLIVTFTADS